MSSRSDRPTDDRPTGDRYVIDLAGPQDAAELLRLYECDDSPGRVRVQYTRRPDPYASLIREGHRVVVPVVRDTRCQLVAGMGACIIRREYVNGEPRTVGYLTGLKGLPDYRMGVPLIPKVYAFLREQTRDEVELYYTTILADNAAVVRMLEKRRPTMPEYRLVDGYTTFCFRRGMGLPPLPLGGIRGVSGARGLTLRPGNLRILDAIWQSFGPESNLTPVRPCLPGLSDDDVFVLRDRAGAVAAACAVWNQQDHKQYVVTGYSGVFRYLRRLPWQLVGYPGLPPENTPVNHATVALLSVRDNDPRLAAALLTQVAASTKRYDFLMLGLCDSHPLYAAMERLRSIRYQSRLYTVHWEPDSLALDGRPVSLDVGRL